MRIKFGILTFFYTIILICFCSCATLANPNINYPAINYAKDKDFSVIPADFTNTFINRFKILYEKNATNIKEVEFYFSEYYKDGEGFMPTHISKSIAPSYYLRLNVCANFTKDSKCFSQYYTIPILAFNPPYSQQFDGLIQKILKVSNESIY